jgi:hypothetical protein
VNDSLIVNSLPFKLSNLDEEGKFTSRGAFGGEKQDNFGKQEQQKSVESKEAAPKDISNLLGIEYHGYKGQQAVDKLYQEKQGHIKAAFHREDIGDIDILWGNDNIGLQHIIKQRTEQGIDATAFLSTLADTVENGEFRRVMRIDKETELPYTNYEIIKNRQVAVVQPEFKGNKFSFIVTAYKTRKASW